MPIRTMWLRMGILLRRGRRRCKRVGEPGALLATAGMLAHSCQDIDNTALVFGD